MTGAPSLRDSWKKWIPTWVLYGVLSLENRVSRWMRNTEPPTGLGSATSRLLILRSPGATSATNWSAGSRTCSS